jgi:hypothetical protein
MAYPSQKSIQRNPPFFPTLTADSLRVTGSFVVWGITVKSLAASLLQKQNADRKASLSGLHTT